MQLLQHLHPLGVILGLLLQPVGQVEHLHRPVDLVVEDGAVDFEGQHGHPARRFAEIVQVTRQARQQAGDLIAQAPELQPGGGVQLVPGLQAPVDLQQLGVFGQLHLSCFILTTQIAVLGPFQHVAEQQGLQPGKRVTGLASHSRAGLSYHLAMTHLYPARCALPQIGIS